MILFIFFLNNYIFTINYYNSNENTILNYFKTIKKKTKKYHPNYYQI